MSALQITTRTRGSHTIVRLVGTLNLATGPVLAARLGELLRSGHHHLILDAAGVHCCDEAGAQLLGCALSRIQAVGGTLAVACPTGEVARMLDAEARGLGVYSNLAQATATVPG